MPRLLENLVLCVVIALIYASGSHGADVSDEEISLMVDKALVDKDVGLIKDWADTQGALLNTERWTQLLETNRSTNTKRNEVVFVAYARSCLFSPRGVARLINDVALRNRLFGGLRIFDATHASLRPPNIGKRYLAGGGKIVGISLRDSKTTPSAVLYVGIGIEKYEIGNSVKIEDIEYVDTEFSDFVIGASRTR